MSLVNFIVLNDQFYIDNMENHEMMRSRGGRPLFLTFEYQEKLLLVPLRSHLPANSRRFDMKTGYLVPSHSKPSAGLDYRKILFVDRRYILNYDTIINRGQRIIVSENANEIRKEIIEYINGYIRCINENRANSMVRYVYQFSTLKYYHRELGLEHGSDTQKTRNDGLTR